jgi:hypothetical protein
MNPSGVEERLRADFMKTSLLLASLLVFSSTLARADYSVDFESGAVWTGANDIRIPADTGTLFSLSDDLKSDPTAFFRTRATYHLGLHHDISFLFAPLRTEADGAFSTPVNFAGTTFAAGAPTTARYRFDSYRLTYRYNFITRDDLTFGLGITGKLRDASIQVDQGGLSARDSNLGFVPLSTSALTGVSRPSSASSSKAMPWLVQMAEPKTSSPPSNIIPPKSSPCASATESSKAVWTAIPPTPLHCFIISARALPCGFNSLLALIRSMCG